MRRLSQRHRDWGISAHSAFKNVFKKQKIQIFFAKPQNFSVLKMIQQKFSKKCLKKSCGQYSKKSVCLVSHCIIKSICFAWLCIIASVFRTQVIYFNTLHSAHLPIFLAAPRKTASYPPAIREAREGCRRDRTAEVLLCVARLKIMLRWKRGSPALVAHNGWIFHKIF